MTTCSSKNVTDLLVDWGNGEQEALDRLIPLVYGQLHRLASRYLRRERPDHTLQTTALVHEAYLKLVDQTRASCENRLQFFAVASQVMRHILVDYARSHNAAKRGGDYVRISLDDALIVSKEKSGDLMVLDEALNKLETIDPQQSRVVEMRVFGGLKLSGVALALRGETSPAQSVAGELVKRYPKETLINTTWLPTIQAALEINRGNAEKAIQLLRGARRFVFFSSLTSLHSHAKIQIAKQLRNGKRLCRFNPWLKSKRHF